jgi:hypothetical protein
MIRIIKSDYELSEEALNKIEEDEGLFLIGVNHVLTREYPSWDCMGPPTEKRDVVRWVYHFRLGG